MLFQQPRPAALDGDAGIDGGQGGEEALAAVGTDHLEALSGEPAAVQVGEEPFPRRGALAGRQAEVDDLLLAVGADAQRHQDGTPQRAGAGLAGQHHAVEHQRLVAGAKRASVEGRHRRVQGPGDAAHGRGRDRTPEQGEQNLTHLAGTEPEHEAGEDGAIDLRPAPGIAPQHPGRTEAPGARYAEFDRAELGQQMTPIEAVAPVAHGAAVEAVEPAIDRFAHPALDDLGQRKAAQRAVALAPFKPIGLHLLHQRKGHR